MVGTNDKPSGISSKQLYHLHGLICSLSKQTEAKKKISKNEKNKKNASKKEQKQKTKLLEHVFELIFGPVGLSV